MEADRPPDRVLTRYHSRKKKSQKSSESPATFPAATDAAVPCGGHGDARDDVVNTLTGPDSENREMDTEPPATIPAATVTAVPFGGLGDVRDDVVNIPTGPDSEYREMDGGGSSLTEFRQPTDAGKLGDDRKGDRNSSVFSVLENTQTRNVVFSSPELPSDGAASVTATVAAVESPITATATHVSQATADCSYGASPQPSKVSFPPNDGSTLQSKMETAGVGSPIKTDLHAAHATVEDQKPNAGSYVDDDGLIHLHCDEAELMEHKPSSFAELLKQSSNLLHGKGRLTYYPPIVSDLGTRRAVIPDDLVLKQASEWALTLSGYFIGKRPAFPFVQYHSRRMWKKYGLIDVILNDQGFFFFKFSSEEGLNFVFENGPWLFNGMPIFIQKWQPGLSFDKPEPTTVPLWANIYGLPLDVWDYDIISYIVSVIGVPISVDRYTADMCEKKTGRANFARVLISASADLELPAEIEALILGKIRKFKVEFPWKPNRCSHCKVFGHDLGACLVQPRTASVLKQDNHLPSVTCVGESSKAKEDGFRFPKRRNKPQLKHKIAPLKIGAPKPRVAVATGIKIKPTYVPIKTKTVIDPLDKGKSKFDADVHPQKYAHNATTGKFLKPLKVSNQFAVLEEDEQWILDKKIIDVFVEKRGVGLGPTIVNSWNRRKLDYFIGQWARVYGKEPNGSLRGFTLPERINVVDDDGDASKDDSDDDDVFSDMDGVMSGFV